MADKDDLEIEDSDLSGFILEDIDTLDDLDDLDEVTMEVEEIDDVMDFSEIKVSSEPDTGDLEDDASESEVTDTPTSEPPKQVKPKREFKEPRVEEAKNKKALSIFNNKKMIIGGAGIAVLLVAGGVALYQQGAKQGYQNQAETISALSIPVSSVSPISDYSEPELAFQAGEIVTTSEESFVPKAETEMVLPTAGSFEAEETQEFKLAATPVLPTDESVQLLEDNRVMATQLEDLIAKNTLLESSVAELSLKLKSSVNPSQIAKLKKNNHLYAVEIDSLKRRLKNIKSRSVEQAGSAVNEQTIKVSGVIPDWTLKGVVGGKALFANASGKTSMAEKGDIINGVKITGIDGDKLSVKTDNGTLSLK